MKPDLPPNDDPEFVISDLGSSSSGPRPMRELRPLLNGLSALVAVAVVIVGVAWLRGYHASPASTTASATNLDGWRNVGLQNVGGIAFAAAAPTTAYACTQPTAANAASPTVLPITLQTSHDGGKSWRASTTPLSGYSCTISVDPTDARDVVLIASGCFGLCDGVTQHDEIIRSYDAGAHWQPITFPARGQIAQARYTYDSVVWAKSTCFVLVYTINANAANNVFVAAAPPHGTATWIDDHGLTQMIPAGYNILDLVTVGSTVFAELRDFNDSSCPSCLQLLRSDDGGQSWQHTLAATPDGQPITSISGVPDGSVLFGVVKDGQAQRLLRSRNGGATWQGTPSLPPAMLHVEDSWQTRDGTLYSVFTDADYTQGRVYALSPTATAWRPVSHVPFNGRLDAVSVDANGRPSALWGIMLLNYSYTRGVLQRHAP